jgi:hypothetical protein
MRAAHKFKTKRKTHRSVTRHVANLRANAPHRAMSARDAHTAHTARANTVTHANRDAKNTNARRRSAVSVLSDIASGTHHRCAHPCQP